MNKNSKRSGGSPARDKKRKIIPYYSHLETTEHGTHEVRLPIPYNDIAYNPKVKQKKTKYPYHAVDEEDAKFQLFSKWVSRVLQGDEILWNEVPESLRFAVLALSHGYIPHIPLHWKVVQEHLRWQRSRKDSVANSGPVALDTGQFDLSTDNERPDTALIEKETQLAINQLIARLISNLSRQDQKVIWMAKIKGYTIERIAKLQHISPTTARVQIHRALKKLRALAQTKYANTARKELALDSSDSPNSLLLHEE